jgi:hypothetical protein
MRFCSSVWQQELYQIPPVSMGVVRWSKERNGRQQSGYMWTPSISQRKQVDAWMRMTIVLNGLRWASVKRIRFTWSEMRRIRGPVEQAVMCVKESSQKTNLLGSPRQCQSEACHLLKRLYSLLWRWNVEGMFSGETIVCVNVYVGIKSSEEHKTEDWWSSLQEGKLSFPLGHIKKNVGWNRREI